MKTQHYYTGRRVGVTICLLWLFLQVNANAPFFPTDIKLNAKGEIFFTQKGTKSIEVYSPDGSQHLRSVALGETPTGFWIEGDKMYVTTFESWGKLHILELESGAVEKTIPTGSGACYPMKSPDSKMIYVCNRYSGTVSEIDPVAGTITRTVKVLREPKAAVFSKDGNHLFVTNYLPAQRADVDIVAACVSVIDMATFTKIKDIQLANGSNAVRGICISPDGKYVYTSHNLGRFTVPTSQLQQGWMNTSAFSVIDVEKLACLGAIVVDEPERGAAGIWTMDCTEDHIFVIHSGTHEVSIIDHQAMRKKFEAYPNKDNLSYDLRFLYGLRERIDLEGNGPRNMVHRNGKLIIPTYFADVLNFVDVDTRTVSSVNLNPGREETAEHKGEKYFNDATKCFQEWQSCNGCHPGDARTDGMNWDLMNDRVGNPKNCKSLLYSHVTPPNMISGIRANAEIAVRAGFKHIQFFDVSEEDAGCMDAYLKALRPVPSPYLVNGELSEKAKEGRKVFEKFKCGNCHSGPYYTDMKMYRIGKDIEFEKGWNTPTLVECWRTAPYLFDGRAATMEEVFEIHKHGIDKKITKKEIEALAEYVNSL